MKAKNSNKKSDLSNIIEVFIPEMKTTDAPEEEKDTKKASVNNKTVGIVVGVIVAVIILIIIVYIVVYSTIVKPKRKKEREEREERVKEEKERKERIAREREARDNNALNPISYIPASTIMEHHKEKTRAKLENKEPPVFTEEDFVDRKISPTNETGEGSSNNDQQMMNRDSKNDALKHNGALPPKSPKRTTPV